MTCPSKRTILICKCPNCGGTEWLERWVDWISEEPPYNMKPQDFLEHRMGLSGPQHGFFPISCCDYIQMHRQFVLSCKGCGYTVLKDFEVEAAKAKEEQEKQKRKKKPCHVCNGKMVIPNGGEVDPTSMVQCWNCKGTGVEP